MEEQSRLSANRRRSMQQFILNSLITDIKNGKHIDFSQIPAEIIAMLQEETAKNEGLRVMVESRRR
jgi:hypothetical protein